MCGICGILQFERGATVDSAEINAMSASLIHRGLDDGGLYVKGRVGLGHRRLSIIDIAGGRQPMKSHDPGSPRVIVYNGEIYNFLELRRELQGHHFRSVGGRYSDETFRYHRTRVRFNLKHFSMLRNFFIGSVDLLNALFFYFLLGPKIVFKKIRHIPIVPENYLGGWFLIRAYIDHLSGYRKLKSMECINFLSDEEMKRFEAGSCVNS